MHEDIQERMGNWGCPKKPRGGQNNKLNVSQNSTRKKPNRPNKQTNNQTKKQPNHKATKQTNKKELLLFYQFENEDVFVKVGRVLLQVLCMIWIFALQCQCVKGA